VAKDVVRISDYRVNRAAWMYVDETGTNDGQFSAHPVIVTTTGLRKIRASPRVQPTCLHVETCDHRDSRAEWSEIGQFPDRNAFTRISALGDYLRLVFEMPRSNRGHIIVRIRRTGIADVSGLEKKRERVREKIWETLFWEFEVFLATRRLYGHMSSITRLPR